MKEKQRKTTNREFLLITYIFLALFLCLMAYMVYFQAVRSEDFINSPYNKRQDSFAKKVVRGDILSADGKILAETLVDESGNETRRYPFENLYAHAVGFATNGKSGLELSMNFNLLRSHSFLPERMLNDLRGEKSIGDNVVTTLNTLLQETAYNALGNYDGAVLVMEPATGKILAMVSKPDYNPNTISENWASLTAEDTEESVLVNRVTQGLYPPGSTFKIITALSYMRQNPNYETYTYECTGSITVGDTTIHCAGGQAHGVLNLKEAFAQSCNCAFADIGLKLRRGEFAQECKSMLFDQTLPGGISAAKSSFSVSENEENTAIMQTAIGQSDTLVSPYHMACIVCAIANQGDLMRPYLVDHTENENGTRVKTYRPTKQVNLMTHEEAALLTEYMREVVTSGTGAKLNGANYTAAGKTGSAEFSNNKSQTHSWFVGFAHQDGKNDIVTAVIAEGAGSGSAVAVPIAKQIFDTYYQGE